MTRSVRFHCTTGLMVWAVERSRGAPAFAVAVPNEYVATASRPAHSSPALQRLAHVSSLRLGTSLVLPPSGIFVWARSAPCCWGSLWISVGCIFYGFIL